MTEEQDKYPVKLTRRGIFAWAGLIFFSMAWMFVVGLLVGRGTTPLPAGAPPLESELKALRQKEQSKIDARTKQGQESGNHMPFYDELKKPSPATAYKIAPPTADTKPAAPAPMEQAPLKVPEAAAKTVQIPDPKPMDLPTEASMEKRTDPPAIPDKEASTPPPAPKPAPAVKPTATPKPAPVIAAAAPDKRFTIQVASFQDLASAERSVKSLQDKGFSAHHRRVEVPGKGVWYRVRIGAFDTKAEAEAMLKKLEKKAIKAMVSET